MGTSATRSKMKRPPTSVRQRGRTEYTLRKATSQILIDALANTYKQNVTRLHPDIWLGCGLFHKALRTKEVCDQLAIAVRRDAHRLVIPVPGEPHGEENHVFQRVELKRECQ